jgi:hypothetical protein
MSIGMLISVVLGTAALKNHRNTELRSGYVQFEPERLVNLLTPNDLLRRRAVSPLKIKIPSKHMREKPTHTPIIHSVY